jgi:hypothetical protein
MATVKMSGGKVVTKEGKVSCTCCAPDCCLYRWPDPDGTDGGPYYPETDLPDTVIFSGETLSHDAGDYQFTGSTYYIVAGTTQWEVRLVSDDSLVQEQDCLIENGVEDEFSDTYSVDVSVDIFPPGEDPVLVEFTMTITRQSLCRWTWTYSDGYGNYTVNVFHDDFLTSPNYPWKFEIFKPYDGVDSGEKNAPQSSPVGAYTGSQGGITVS